MNGEDEAHVDDLRPRDGPEWARFVRGVAALLRETGCFISGADLLIDGDLPLGSGLSSSASLELGVAVALMTLAGWPIEPTALARLGQRVENEIVGVQSGIMDQLAVACGVAGHALLIDCRTFATEPVPLPPEVRMLVLDSAVPRTLAGSAYNATACRMRVSAAETATRAAESAGAARRISRLAGGGSAGGSTQWRCGGRAMSSPRIGACWTASPHCEQAMSRGLDSS